ncbi:MAG: septum formation protein Maf [Acidobacteria bacterium]|nr:MAG: septum formation protein Maf [Acidobacteriota bacterium]
MPSQPRLILASASPRRLLLLRNLDLSFMVRTSHIAETRVPGEGARQRAVRLAREKARDVASRLRQPAWVLGADTLVVAGTTVLEKPVNRDDALRMLDRLSGCRHTVITGICLTPAHLPGRRESTSCRTTRVTFSPLSHHQKNWLLTDDEYKDKAGAYAVQGRAAAFISSLTGSPSNVIGLPLDLVYEFLEEAGYMPAPVRRRHHPAARSGTRQRS